MVGYAEAKGLIPLTCSKLFDDIDDKMSADANLRIRVEVSYIEIYNEKVRDLLNPKTKGNLKVREHPSLGPYVEDLSKLVVSSFNDVESLMDEGNKARTVAATNMNETSSRSHAVFTLVVTQKRKDEQTQLEAEKVSRISLVDLAGSERANSTGATGSRLKEGANINRSLTTLGKVIAALATASMETTKSTPRKKTAAEHVPYRDSVLTWLLKDSLGGNSKTAMIAAISPADYEETLSTLRYADQAKKIKNKAVVNEDPNAKLIRELKEELETLRARASGGPGGSGFGEQGEWDPSIPPEKQVVRYQTKTGEIKTVTKAELQEQMEQNEKLMSTLNESWEDKLQKTQQIQQEREKALEELGITIDKGNVGVHTPKNLPHLVNLNEDALMNECLLYQLKVGSTTVGNLESEANVQIRLSGSKILPVHCRFENMDGNVTLHAMPDSMTMVNGKRILSDQPKRLRSGYRVILGDFHVFRVNNPGEVRKARDRVKSATALSTGETAADSPRPDSPISEDGHDVDWTYARREAIMNHLNGQNVGLDHLSNEDLDRLFADISRVRNRKAGGVSSSGFSRPESRLSSVMDDSESSSSMARPFSLSTYTDDTSIDPWSGVDGQTLDASSPTPSRFLGEQPPHILEKGTASKEADLLRATIKTYEDRFSRLPPEAAALLDEPAPLSDEQRRLVRDVLDRWRTKTKVSMTEDILSHAALLKEANVISRELGKATTYQFTVIDAAPLSNPTSSIEAVAGLTEYDDVADADLATGPKPCIAVKVFDRAHGSIYVWSLTKLQQRLHKMRNLYTFIDRPEYSQHFNWADPFYEIPAPSYTFVGASLVSLLPLTRRQSAKYEQTPIVSTLSDSIVGSCTVEVKFVSLTAPPSRGQRGQTELQKNSSQLCVGHKLGVQLNVDNVTGLSQQSLAAVHLQLRLSSVAGLSIERDDTFASAPVQIDSDEDFASLRLRKTVAIILTEQILSHLQTGLMSIEFHGRVQDKHIVDAVARDHTYEKELRSSNGASRLGIDPTSHEEKSNGRADNAVATGRLAETELINERRHDILASVQLCELDASGEYRPVGVKVGSDVEIGGGVFQLRQGLQRKLVVRLSHDSGHQLDWTSVTRLCIGDIRLLDAKGRIHDSTGGVMIPLNIPSKQQSINFASNGISELDSWAWWDSSIHDSLFLNRVTPAAQRVLLRIDFDIGVPTCATPPRFSTTIAVAVQPRDARPPGRLMSFVMSAAGTMRILNKSTSLFALKLMPPVGIKTRELWRLDTSNRYVRGQELLSDWKPLRIGYIAEHQKFLEKQKNSAYISGWRVVLKSIDLRKPKSISSVNTQLVAPSQEDLLTRVTELWQSAVKDGRTSISLLGGATSPTNLEQCDSVTTSTEIATSASKSDTGDKPVRLIARVDLVPASDKSARKGLLSMPLDSQAVTGEGNWTARFFVLKRPHLLVYTDSTESDLTLAIHLGGSVRVEHDENVATMLGRPHAFSLYTSNNSYFLEAQDQRDMQGWIGALHGHHGGA